VINTASFVAVMGAATSQISYTASKGACSRSSRELGVEFARSGVRVNALCPGPIDTRCSRSFREGSRARGAPASCTYRWCFGSAERSPTGLFPPSFN